jgi:L-asparagine transporter-like permease
MLHVAMLYKFSIRSSQYDQGKKTIYTWYMIVFSLVRLGMLMPYRYTDREFKTFSNVRWIVLFIMEIIGAAMFFFFTHVKGSNTFACCLIDCICLISMFFIYKINEASRTQDADNKEPLLKCLNVS